MADLPDIPKFDDLKYTYPDYSNLPASSVVVICKGVPLDNSYTHTLTFSNLAAQQQYFQSKAKATYTALSPIGLNTNVRIPAGADSLYDCNYCIIQNPHFTTKNLYCFITNIEYVNLNVCNVYFEIDIFQTWYFDMQIHACLVEREHVNDDTIGANTLEEGLQLGEYKRRYRTRAGVASRYGIMVSMAGDVNDADYNKLTAGIFSGLKQYYFEVQNNSAAPIQDFIQQYVNAGTEDKIISIQMIPADFYTERGSAAPIKNNFKVTKDLYEIDGYTPKNNKLFTFPYTYLEVDNTQGEITVLRYELFEGNECNFRVEGSTSGDSPTLLLYPVNYDNIGSNVMEHSTLAGFPQCAWSGDAYKAYLAHNSMKNTVNIASSVISTGTGVAINAAAGNLIGATATLATGAVRAGSQLGSMAAENASAKIEANKMRGTKGSNPLFASNLLDFWFTRKMIDKSHAQMIDSYFTRYGYAVNQIKVPNLTGRKSFNYVKTIGSCVTGSIPFNDLAKINAVFDNGITFWHGDYVGQFDRDNSII